MPLYTYKAKGLNGKIEKGLIEAADGNAVTARLREDNLFALSVKLASDVKQNRRLKPMELSDFCREMGTMLAAGISLLSAVGIIARRTAKEKIKNIYLAIGQDLKNGDPMWKAMENQTGAFPKLLTNMVASGEASGGLDRTFMKMAEHYQKEYRLRAKIRGAATYPILLLVVVVLVMIGLFTFVLPNFFSMFEGMELPAITRAIMWMSSSLINYWLYILIVVLIVAFAIVNIIRIPRVRLSIDHFKIRMPVFGKLFRIIYTARFARTLSSLYSSGLNMLNSLDISSTTIGNSYLSSQFGEVVSSVRRGGSLSQALSAVDGFDPKLASIVMIGEESGKLEDMLASMADSFDYDAEVATNKLTSILEPLLIILMGIIVGVVMLSVMIPLFDVYNNIS